MPDRQFIAYYRVSTDRQGQSGLGLEAQRASVLSYVDSDTGDLLAEYTEIESGRRNSRPQLAMAIQHCRKGKATLVIAKLDRLARNTRFLLGIVESGIDAAFCDMPEMPPGAVGKFMLTQLAAVAELEAGLTSERTKAALAAAKARGVKLGNPDLKRHNDRQRASAQRFARSLTPVVQSIRSQGHSSVRAIRDQLNAMEVASPGGGQWHVPSVHRLLKRVDRVAA
jgi:DNA invertase Pin-like site-specific DNA recombinase